MQSLPSDFLRRDILLSCGIDSFDVEELNLTSQDCAGSPGFSTTLGTDQRHWTDWDIQVFCHAESMAQKPRIVRVL